MDIGQARVVTRIDRVWAYICMPKPLGNRLLLNSCCTRHAELLCLALTGVVLIRAESRSTSTKSNLPIKAYPAADCLLLRGQVMRYSLSCVSLPC